MEKPYIVCHMMASLDGRIDCAMTTKLVGVDDYYTTLSQLLLDANLSGRVTAQTEMALEGVFNADGEAYGIEGFRKNTNRRHFEVVTDSKGTLLWENDYESQDPHIIITSKQVKKDYLDYLNKQHISWIVAGDEKVDLLEATKILYREFDIKRLGIVGGPTINGAFLDAGLLDEVSILFGLGIDGRKGMPGIFDGLNEEHDVTKLELMDNKTFPSGAVWLRYKVQNIKEAL